MRKYTITLSDGSVFVVRAKSEEAAIEYLYQDSDAIFLEDDPYVVSVE